MNPFLQEAAEVAENAKWTDPIGRKNAHRAFGPPANHFRAPMGATQVTAITCNILVLFCGQKFPYLSSIISIPIRAIRGNYLCFLCALL